MFNINFSDIRRYGSIFVIFAIVNIAIVSFVNFLFIKETATEINLILCNLLAVLFSTIVTRIDLKGPKKNEDLKALSVNPVSRFWNYFTITMTIFGIQIITSFMVMSAIIWVNWPSGSLQSSLYIEVMINTFMKMITNTAYIVGTIALFCLPYFLGGFLSGKTVSNVRYTHIAFSSLIVVAINFLPILVIAFTIDGSIALFLANLIGLYTLLYVGMALVGMRLGTNRPNSGGFL